MVLKVSELTSLFMKMAHNGEPIQSNGISKLIPLSSLLLI